MKQSSSKKSLLPHWDGEVYTKVAAPFYNTITRWTGWQKKIERHALKGLKPGKLLDVGCGTGFLMNLAQRQGFEAYGVDPSKGMLEKARINYGFHQIQLVQSEAHLLPFSGKSYDIITSSGALVHIPSLKGLSKEFSRVLKSKGTLRIIDHARPVRFNILTPFSFVFSQLSGDVLHDYPKQFEKHFKLIHRETIGRGGYMQIFDFEKIK